MLRENRRKIIFKTRKDIKRDEGFPSGLVVKNPPANARDMGSIPGQGRSHMPQSNEARVLQLLRLLYSPEAAITEALVL